MPPSINICIYPQVTSANIVRVAESSPAQLTRLKAGLRIVSIADDMRTYTTVQDMISLLYVFVGTVRLMTMPLSAYLNTTKPPQYV